ncbi:hypothetical protein [Polaribacter cellanae]|uniref:Beta-lactamase-inhibitor-like PepSY-like domain-containing protein n=1 Tax=Polaribacter cellanae TaxID=2818493 RepID=A0A975CN46_9FLAO|nr:hypothetical protein [Polaribacter cellanae]QTE22384.1 hypothetical protein J3359_16515 [Polaribacter cellanae]
MKKLILTVAILAGGFSTFATPNNIVKAETICVVSIEGFKEIAVDKLPKAVLDAVLKDYAKSKISKAYVNESKQYKLELNTDEVISTVYIDKDGNWLEETDIIDNKEK